MTAGVRLQGVEGSGAVGSLTFMIYYSCLQHVNQLFHAEVLCPQKPREGLVLHWVLALAGSLRLRPTPEKHDRNRYFLRPSCPVQPFLTKVSEPPDSADS